MPRNSKGVISLGQLDLLHSVNSCLVINKVWVRKGKSRLFIDTRGNSISLSSKLELALINKISAAPIALSRIYKGLGATYKKSQIYKAVIELISQGLVYAQSGSSVSTLHHDDALRFQCQLKYFEQFERTGLNRFDIQTHLFQSHVTIIGVGGLGSNLAMLLAAAGVRKFTLIDGDVVESSNLPRQFHYNEGQLGEFKVNCLASNLKKFDTKITCIPISEFVTDENSLVPRIRETDLVVLCADEPKFKIQAWVGEGCFKLKKPYITMAGNWIGPLYIPGKSPCYVCQTNFNMREIAHTSAYLNLHSKRNQRIVPSFPTGPALVASLMGTAIIEYLGGYETERLSNTRFFVDIHGNHETVIIPKYLDCWKCGS